ncbi:MAG TPA: hypothetical protein VD866_04510 [Urbifossiella sp.]|nr:hypothetical protein [Urbifossiella sp.]
MSDTTAAGYDRDSVAGVRILDRQTGRVHVVEGDFARHTEEWWCEGNGSCDCNRALACGVAEWDNTYCLGCNRFIILDDAGQPRPGWNDGYTLP